MKTMKDKLQFALKPDAQAFDEVRIKIVPRFKQSELSGDEWRISTLFEFYRNGEVIYTDSAGGNMETACGMLFYKYVCAIDNGHAFFASDQKHCDQEGCANDGKFIMRIKESYDDRGKRDPLYDGSCRLFCEKHSHRGNSSLGDRDENYEMIGVL